eukprot:3154714-Amphidinium_carterae.1
MNNEAKCPRNYFTRGFVSKAQFTNACHSNKRPNMLHCAGNLRCNEAQAKQAQSDLAKYGS